ncbi:CNNM domain-containing protein [Pleionea sp. CnH1-48]|uniref:CNNM domain-containing protein n=1 Tax=Pleionea sp. CnH1-48 TaxID=2954494 RepID=UPI0020970179|nr:hemolysin family protein [Pleionea sp. CnH1-48]MCO7225641.1 hemolysin family protein [Pleionea sp. CnH1-48]
MTLLVIYIVVAIGFSFACSIMEAVLLSVNSAHIALLEKEEKKHGPLLRALKDEIGKPLAAILTLNTIAHTIGAAGAGAQAAAVFGNAYVGVASAVLTLLILVFSEIIPKTLGAFYWKQLSPITAYTLKYLIIILYPFVKLSEILTQKFTSKPTLSGFSREEFSVMAELSSKQGQIAEQESRILKNLLLMKETQVKDAMTPRTVIFSLSDNVTVEEFFHKYDKYTFSRIPIYSGDQENITHFVFRSDLLLAQARGNSDNTLANYGRDLHSILSSMLLDQALNELLSSRVHMLLVVNEYGGVEGVITLEDVLETLLGLEIVDEKDKAVDMQEEARRQWQKRMKEKGMIIND